MSWFRNGGPTIRSAEGTFAMRPGKNLWIDDEISNVVDIQARPFEKLAFLLGFNGHFATKDRVDDVGGVDVLITRILVLFVIVVLAVTPVGGACSLGGVILNNLLRIDILENTVVLYSVVGSRMQLTRALQGFVVIFLLITATSRSFDHVDFMVIFMRPLAPEVIAMVVTPVLAFSVVSIVVAAMVAVIDPPTVVMVVIASWRVIGLLSSCHVFLDQLLGIVSIGVVLGSGEKLGDRGRPLPK